MNSYLKYLPHAETAVIINIGDFINSFRVMVLFFVVTYKNGSHNGRINHTLFRNVVRYKHQVKFFLISNNDRNFLLVHKELDLIF